MFVKIYVLPQAQSGRNAICTRLRVTYMLPVDPNGVSDRSILLLENAKAAGVVAYSTDVMTMDFGVSFSTNKKMADVCIASIEVQLFDLVRIFDMFIRLKAE